MDGYGQYCPVAMAAEILTRRWTPLVVRELLCGSRRFNDLQRGVPRMSRSLLSTRLTELERAGIVERRTGADGGHPEYHLTDAGEDLRPIIMQLGVWGKRWARRDFRQDDLDPALLMWDIRRRIERDRLPPDGAVVRLEFTDPRLDQRTYWLCLDPDDIDVCFDDPGFEVDLHVRTDVRTLTEIWIGDGSFGNALRCGDLVIRGPSHLRRAFPGWLGLSLFAEYERVASR